MSLLGSAKDSAGFTLSQVESMSGEEQFALLAERNARMEQLLSETQQQISMSGWDRLLKGLTIRPGVGGYQTPRGADNQNSYILLMNRYIIFNDVEDRRAEAERIYDFFESQGWEATLVESEDTTLWIVANTEDGYQIKYDLRANGQCNLEVYSSVFWGNYSALQNEYVDRIPEGVDEEDLSSDPGIFLPFPKWNDPKTNR